MNKHHHYDWGLRSIRTVLTECGRTLKTSKMKDNHFNESNETDIILQVLRDDTLPKLTNIDSIKFSAILEDVFQKKDSDDRCHDPIVKHIETSFEELGLIRNDRQVSKKKGNYGEC